MGHKKHLSFKDLCALQCYLWLIPASFSQIFAVNQNTSIFKNRRDRWLFQLRASLTWICWLDCQRTTTRETEARISTCATKTRGSAWFLKREWAIIETLRQRQTTHHLKNLFYVSFWPRNCRQTHYLVKKTLAALLLRAAWKKMPRIRCICNFTPCLARSTYSKYQGREAFGGGRRGADKSSKEIREQRRFCF